MRVLSLTGLVLIALLVTGPEAAEMRGRNPIMAPAALPAGARAVDQIRPVDRRIVEAAVRRLFAACCNDIAALDRLLSDDLVDKSRILDNFAERFPRDARLKVLGIQSVQTLSQHIEADPAGGEVLVSQVSVTVRSELQFTDSLVGFARLPGTVEYIFHVEQKMQ